MNIFDHLAVKYENSDFYRNKIIKRYKPLITPGVKSQDELIVSLEKHFDLEESETATVTKSFLELCVYGNINCDNPEMLDFQIFKVVRNEKSAVLYACEEEDLLGEDIYIIFEEHNNFFISNSQIVEMLLIIKEGVTEEDYEEETPEFYNYLLTCHYFKQSDFFKLNKPVEDEVFEIIGCDDELDDEDFSEDEDCDADDCSDDDVIEF